ncbi:MAG: hypothetical protein WCX69_00730 [Candidatus Paceibacterota bacterium]
MNQELIDYINQQTKISVSKNKITSVLLEQGWRQAEIDEAFAAADGAIGVAKTGGIGEGGIADFGSEKSGARFGANRKVILFAAISLVVLAAAIALVLLGGKKKTETALPADKDNNIAKTADDNAANEAQEKLAKEAQAKIDAAMRAAIDKLEASIQPPSGWTARQAAVRSRPMAVFFKPTVEKDKSGKEVFNENISVLRDIYKSKSVSDEPSFLEYSRQLMKAAMENYKITSEKEVSLGDGTKATLFYADFTQEGLALKDMQMYAFKGDDVYIVTGIVLASNWEKEKDMIGTSILSFKIPAVN